MVDERAAEWSVIVRSSLTTHLLKVHRITELLNSPKGRRNITINIAPSLLVHRIAMANFQVLIDVKG